MNFHEDVSMREVHILLYEMVTGKVNRYPYLCRFRTASVLASA
ncbi:hypothetical protein PO124_32435 [Bacillus licheniformis]|nr:hypothetical protein [Bacillus licheniformis]